VTQNAAAYRVGVPRKLPPSAYAVPRPASTARRAVINPFGTPQAETWSVPEAGSDGGLRAALLQHRIARQIRDAIADSESGTLAELCRRHRHLSYERLRGVLAGDVWMRLDDIAETAHVLELDVVVSLDPGAGRR
jgi:hypothetical protein